MCEFGGSVAAVQRSLEEEDVDVPPLPDSLPQRILWASEYGRLDIVKDIISQNKNLVNSEDDDGYTPLHRAAYKDHADIVEELILTGAKLDKKTMDGWTPLHSACHWGNVHSASVLISAGCDINALTKSEQTPLHIAANHLTSATPTLIELLIMTPGIKFNIKNSSGDTPKDIAEKTGAAQNLFEVTDLVLNMYT